MVLNTQNKLYFFQAFPKNTCQFCLPKTIPKSKSSNPWNFLWSSLSFEIWSTLPEANAQSRTPSNYFQWRRCLLFSTEIMPDMSPANTKERKRRLLVFNVTPFKIDRNKNQNRSIDKAQNLGNERRYIYKGPFVYEISEEMFYPNLQRFVWRRHAGAHLDELQHGGRKPTETSVTEFCNKSVNLFS